MYPRSQSTSAPTNSFLSALPDAEYQRLSPHLKKVSLHQRQVLHEAGSPPGSVYFLTSGIASLTLSSEEGKEMELSIVGDEGILGERAIFAGNGLQIIRCAMITNGSGYKMPPDIFHQEFNRGGVLQQLVLTRLESRIIESSQTALCNQMHTLEQRLCRWLLTFADRLHTEEIPVTQELASQMLGTRRAGVTLAAGVLREAGLIEYSRGRMTILDRAGLEDQVCECYEVIKNATQPSGFEGRQDAGSGRGKDRVQMGNQTPTESTIQSASGTLGTSVPEAGLESTSNSVRLGVSQGHLSTVPILGKASFFLDSWRGGIPGLSFGKNFPVA